MSERPTEPGFYWARVRSAFHAEPTWQPVLLIRAGHQVVIDVPPDAPLVGRPAAVRWDAYTIGDDQAYELSEVAEWGARIERETDPPTRAQVEAAIDSMSGVNSVLRGEPGALMAENPLQDPITVPPGVEPGQLAVEELTRGEAAVRFAKPPAFGAALEGIADKVAQLVANVARERTRRLELAVLRCFARDQRVDELRIHTDASGLELRAELIVAGEVAETVDLSDMDPNRLMRDSGKPPA